MTMLRLLLTLAFAATAFAQMPACSGVWVVTSGGSDTVTLKCVTLLKGDPGIQGPTGATGAPGAPGASQHGISCASLDGQPTLMVKLNDGSCLPVIVVTATTTANTVLDGTGTTYSPSGWKLAGVVLP